MTLDGYRNSELFATATAGARLMIAFTPLFALWIGCAYILGDPARTSTPSFHAAQSLFPMYVWGALFIAIGASMLVSVLLHSRNLVVITFIGAAATYVAWSVFFIGSAVLESDASLTAPALYLMVAVGHWATVASLAKNRIDRG